MKRIYAKEVDGVRRRGRTRRRWRNGIVLLVEQKGFNLGICEKLARNMSDWQMIA